MSILLSICKKSAYLLLKSIWSINLALPYYEILPTHFIQFILLPTIPLHILVELGLPKISIRSRPLRSWAFFMPVPKASMNKYYALMLGQNNIRIAREFVLMYSETKSHTMDDRSNGQLWFRIITANATHYLTSLLGRKYINHFCCVVKEDRRHLQLWRREVAVRRCRFVLQFQS